MSITASFSDVRVASKTFFGISIGWLLTFGITFAVWLPCLRNDFVDWDDLNMIVNNARLNPPSWSGVGWYWTHPAFDLYWPMTTTLWSGLAYMGWVQTPDQFGGHLNPMVFHLAGVILHTLTTVILYSILNRLIRNQSAAVAGALIFGLHPIQVEAVVFAGVLDNPLAGFFSVLSIAQYLAAVDPGNTQSPRVRIAKYSISLIALIFALLSKPIAVVVPPIALAFDLAFYHRDLRQSLRSILPWMLAILPCLVWTRQFQHGSDAVHTSILLRPLVAGDAISYHLFKIFWPLRFAIDYGRSPHFVLASGIGWKALVAPVALTMTALVCWHRQRVISAAVVIFLVGLLPNSGLLPFDYQLVSTVADRYAYFAMIGIALGLTAITNRFPRTLPAFAMILVFLAVRVEMQIPTWKNGETLFRHALEVNPDSWMSEMNLASVIADRSPDEAIDLCQRAIALGPDRPDPWNTIGTIRLAGRDQTGAIAAFKKAHELEPADLLFQSNLDHATGPARPPKSP